MYGLFLNFIRNKLIIICDTEHNFPDFALYMSIATQNMHD